MFGGDEGRFWGVDGELDVGGGIVGGTCCDAEEVFVCHYGFGSRYEFLMW